MTKMMMMRVRRDKTTQVKVIIMEWLITKTINRKVTITMMIMMMMVMIMIKVLVSLVDSHLSKNY